MRVLSLLATLILARLAHSPTARMLDRYLASLLCHKGDTAWVRTSLRKLRVQ